MYNSAGDLNQYYSSPGSFPLKTWMYLGFVYNYDTGIENNKGNMCTSNVKLLKYSLVGKRPN